MIFECYIYQSANSPHTRLFDIKYIIIIMVFRIWVRYSMNILVLHDDDDERVHRKLKSIISLAADVKIMMRVKFNGDRSMDDRMSGKGRWLPTTHLSLSIHRTNFFAFYIGGRRDNRNVDQIVNGSTFYYQRSPLIASISQISFSLNYFIII